jgi:pimeloyl-ACP methyl ester carboxylesterase
MNLKEHQIELNGLSINYVEGGSGQAMIFMHNGGGFWHSWEHQVKHFSTSYKVYGIDWPGFGESEAPDHNITLKLLSETLSAFIREKNLKNVILVGNCIGGSAALHYCMHNENSVEKLLIFNICPGNLVVRLPIMRRYLMYLNRRPKSKRMFGKVLRFSAMKTPIQNNFPKILFGKVLNKESDLWKRYYKKFKIESQMKSRLKLLFAADSYNLENYLNGNEIPDHLLVWGEHNRVTSLEDHGQTHYKMLRSNRFEVVKNAGHLCMYERPSEVIALIEDYISKSD